MQSKTQKLVTVAFLIAISIVLTRFCSINTPILRIGFGFLPCALIGIAYGPLWAGVGYAIADILGMMIFPTGMFFPGFTLTALLTGFAYGFLYRNQNVTFKSSIIPNAVVSFGLNLILDTIWLTILMGQGFWVLLPTRLIKCVVMFFIQVILIPLVWNRIVLHIPGAKVQSV